MVPLTATYNREYLTSLEKAREMCEELSSMRESIERMNLESQEALDRSNKVFKKIKNSKINRAANAIINFVEFIFSLFVALYVYFRDILIVKKIEKKSSTVLNPDLFQEKSHKT